MSDALTRFPVLRTTPPTGRYAHDRDYDRDRDHARAYDHGHDRAHDDPVHERGDPEWRDRR